MKRASFALAALVVVASAAPAYAEDKPFTNERLIQRVLRQSLSIAEPGWAARLVPDETLSACSAVRNKPSHTLAEQIKKRERKTIRYPADGNLIGDWKRGEAIARSGYGMRFNDYPATRPNGGNCYACHQLDPAEVSFGTIGISLKNYGKLHATKGQARIVYDKIYNSQAQVACSLMPRFGANGVLSIDQIRDLVAYLLDPESPVNK
ncbi:MAG: sulfur oxidation c-type cytochrome SoxX [Hyphomicrobiaceae bacterium]